MISAVIIICHVLVYCFGSFLLQDMFFKSPSICFGGTKYDVYCKCVVNLHSKFICDVGPGYD